MQDEEGNHLPGDQGRHFGCNVAGLSVSFGFMLKPMEWLQSSSSDKQLIHMLPCRQNMCCLLPHVPAWLQQNPSTPERITQPLSPQGNISSQPWRPWPLLHSAVSTKEHSTTLSACHSWSAAPPLPRLRHLRCCLFMFRTRDEQVLGCAEVTRLRKRRTPHTMCVAA